MTPVITPCYAFIHERYNDTIFNMILFLRAMSRVPCLQKHLANAARSKPAACYVGALINKKAFGGDAFLENTCALNDGIRELAKDYKKVRRVIPKRRKV